VDSERFVQVIKIAVDEGGRDGAETEVEDL
jgi:hypothetical protein